MHDNDNLDYSDPYIENPGAFNIIDAEGEPTVLRNVARYYGAKGEPWSDGMMRRLNAAANDNEPSVGRSRASKRVWRAEMEAV